MPEISRPSTATRRPMPRCPRKIFVSPSSANRPVPVVAVYVLFHRDFDPMRSGEVVARFDGLVASEFDAVNGVVAHLPLDRVVALAADDDVMYVEPPLPRMQTAGYEPRPVRIWPRRWEKISRAVTSRIPRPGGRRRAECSSA